MASRGHVKPGGARDPAGTREEARRGGVSSLSDCLGSFLSSSGLTRKLSDTRVLAAWREALGPELAPRARAVRFRRGELTVEVASAVHRQELDAFTGDSFRRAANERLGAETIRRVTFRLKQ